MNSPLADLSKTADPGCYGWTPKKNEGRRQLNPKYLRSHHSSDGSTDRCGSMRGETVTGRVRTCPTRRNTKKENGSGCSTTVRTPQCAHTVWGIYHISLCDRGGHPPLWSQLDRTGGAVHIGSNTLASKQTVHHQFTVHHLDLWVTHM